MYLHNKRLSETTNCAKSPRTKSNLRNHKPLYYIINLNYNLWLKIYFIIYNISNSS